MPCMGPLPANDKQIEEAYADVIKVLEKHGVYFPDLDDKNIPIFSALKESRPKVIEALKKAIGEAITQSNYEGF